MRLAGLDVANAWVLVLRYLPEEISPERRQQLANFASLRHKAMVARDHGARGLIVVSGPSAKVKQPLVELSLDTALAGTSIAALSITDEVAEQWLQRSGHDLKSLQEALDTGKPLQGFRWQICRWPQHSTFSMRNAWDAMCWRA